MSIFINYYNTMWGKASKSSHKKFLIEPVSNQVSIIKWKHILNICKWDNCQVCVQSNLKIAVTLGKWPGDRYIIIQGDRYIQGRYIQVWLYKTQTYSFIINKYFYICLFVSHLRRHSLFLQVLCGKVWLLMADSFVLTWVIFRIFV